MRGINLILRNSLRNTFRRPAKLIGLSALVALLSLVLSLVVNINARVIDGYNQLQQQSNLHTIVMPLDPFERVPTGDTPGFEQAPKNLVAAQQYWLYQLQKKYDNDLETAFYWSRTEAREFSQVYDSSTNLTLKILAKTTPENELNHPIPGLGNQVDGVDDLVVFSGRKMTSGIGHEVVVDNVFAQKHNLKINDIIRIQSDNFGSQIKVDSHQNENIDQNFLNDLEKIRDQISAPDSKGINDPSGLYMIKYEQAYDWYQIVGLGGSVDFTMPVLNKSSPIPNRDKEGLLYVDSSVFGLKVNGDYGFVDYNQQDGRLTVTSQNEWESFYSLANKNGKIPPLKIINAMNIEFNQLVGRNADQQSYFYSRNNNAYRYALRTAALQATIKYYSIGIVVFLVLLIIVIVFSIWLVLEKQVDHSRGQVGITKSLGYTPMQIGLNYSMLPIFTSLIGGIIGFAIAIPVTAVLIREFMNYFILNYGVSKFNWGAFFATVAIFFVVLSIITFIVINLIVRKNTAELISGQKQTKVSAWAQFWKAQVAHRRFDDKLQTALLLRASGKMTLVGTIVFIATILFTISFAGPNLLRKNQTAAFYGVKYQQLVEYAEPVYNNPFTFYKTFNIENNLDVRAEYKYSPILNGYVPLPLDDQGNYDLNQITSDYFNNTQSGEYYSLVMPKSGNSINLITPNQHFLAAYNLAPSLEFYRFSSQWGKTDLKLFARYIFNQWPDYVTLLENLKNNDSPQQNLADLQYFYKKVTSSIGLSVSNMFWEDIRNGDDIPDNQTKINHFNENNLDPSFNNSKEAANQVFRYDPSQFNSNLTSLVNDVRANGFDFQFTNDEWGVGSYRIQPPYPVDKNDYVDDFYVMMNVASLDDQEVNDYLKKMIVWFGALISGRSDQAIIQAAYSRPPYFVQQAMKKAYNSAEQYVPYYQSFGVVPYNNQQEQYGTRFRVTDENDQNPFKIYGIENNNRFLDLRNKRDQNLIQTLYNARTTSKDGQKIYNVVINQSVAKTLNLETDSVVSLNALQQQLTDNATVATLESDWQIGNTATSNSTFKQLNSLNYSSWAFLNSEQKRLNLYNLLSGTDNRPNDYYQEFLDGKLRNREISHPVLFKVLGIHQGYGERQAWIKNEDAEEILNFSPMKDFFWKNFFTSQWNGIFADVANQIVITHSDGTKSEFFPNEIFNPLSSTMASYNDFRPLLTSADPKIKQSAMVIDQIFNNSFPIFNYKYSNKADVGDLSNAVSIFQAYGDYSPMAMNGATYRGSQIEGISQGAIDTIVPVSIKKAILDQISALVRLLLILLILAILLITFVIIFLTVNLIIDDNIRFIATLKVLGYSNNYIVRAVLSMYFIVIACTFVIGFIAGWFIFKTIVKAFQPGIVLPLAFPAWLPIVVALGVIGIYLITLAVGYWTIVKANPLTILQSEVI